MASHETPESALRQKPKKFCCKSWPATAYRVSLDVESFQDSAASWMRPTLSKSEGKAGNAHVSPPSALRANPWPSRASTTMESDNQTMSLTADPKLCKANVSPPSSVVNKPKSPPTQNRPTSDGCARRT